MRYDPRADLAAAIAIALGVSPLLATAAMAGGPRGMAAWCGEPVRGGGHRPVGGLDGCHACLFSRREGEEEEAG